MGWGNESLFAGYGSHDQDGHHAHIWLEPFKNLLLQNQRNQRVNDLVALYVDIGPIILCSNDDPRLTLTYFTARSNLISYAFIW